MQSKCSCVIFLKKISLESDCRFVCTVDARWSYCMTVLCAHLLHISQFFCYTMLIFYILRQLYVSAYVFWTSVSSLDVTWVNKRLIDDWLIDWLIEHDLLFFQVVFLDLTWYRRRRLQSRININRSASTSSSSSAILIPQLVSFPWDHNSEAQCAYVCRVSYAYVTGVNILMLMLDL